LKASIKHISARRQEVPSWLTWLEDRRDAFLVAARFVGWIAAFLILALLPFWQAVRGDEVLWTARAAYEVLRVFGVEVLLSGSSLSRGVVEILEVYPGCSGVTYCLFFAAAVLAFPALWWKRLAGVLIGSVVLLGMNVGRVVCMFVVGVANPGLFVVIHEVAWPVVSIVATVALAAFWLAWVLPGKAADC